MAFAPARANLVQLGRQTSLSAVAAATAATTKWRGEGATDIVDARKRVRVAENIGLAGNTDRLYDAAELGRLAMASTPFTFEQGPHIFEGGIKAATPTGTYTRIYDLPQANTPNTIKHYSIEAGNAVIGGDAHVLPGAFVEDFELSGEAGPDGTAWMIAANWVGQRKTLQTFTAALTAPTVEEAIFSKTKIYLDPSAGTIGQTLKSNVLVKASIKVKTGWVAVPTADGTLYFTAVKYVIPDDQVTFDLTFELEDVAGVVIAERAFYVSKAIRLIRLTCPGSTAALNLEIDIAARYSEFSTYENTNGNVTVTVTGYGLISTVDSKYFTATVKNNVAALP
jgi:hypothetical protein